jgi:hypothetical protein
MSGLNEYGRHDPVESQVCPAVGLGDIGHRGALELAEAGFVLEHDRRPR